MVSGVKLDKVKRLKGKCLKKTLLYGRVKLLRPEDGQRIFESITVSEACGRSLSRDANSFSYFVSVLTEKRELLSEKIVAWRSLRSYLKAQDYCDLRQRISRVHLGIWYDAIIAFYRNKVRVKKMQLEDLTNDAAVVAKAN